MPHCAACLTLPLIDRGSRAEVQPQLFPRLTFRASNPLRTTRSESAHEALDRFVGIREPLSLDQILVNPLCTTTSTLARIVSASVRTGSLAPH